MISTIRSQLISAQFLVVSVINTLQCLSHRHCRRSSVVQKALYTFSASEREVASAIGAAEGRGLRASPTNGVAPFTLSALVRAPRLRRRCRRSTSLKDRRLRLSRD